MEPTSTYIFAEELDDDVLSLPGVRAVAKLAHPVYGWFIGLTDGVADLGDVFALVLGAQQVHVEAIPEWPDSWPEIAKPRRIVHRRPEPKGYLALSLGAKLPDSELVDEATFVGEEWLVLWNAERREQIPVNAWLATEFRYDDAEALVSA